MQPILFFLIEYEGSNGAATNIQIWSAVRYTVYNGIHISIYNNIIIVFHPPFWSNISNISAVTRYISMLYAANFGVNANLNNHSRDTWILNKHIQYGDLLNGAKEKHRFHMCIYNMYMHIYIHTYINQIIYMYNIIYTYNSMLFQRNKTPSASGNVWKRPCLEPSPCSNVDCTLDRCRQTFVELYLEKRGSIGNHSRSRGVMKPTWSFW